MSESEDVVNPPYTEASRARLVLASELADLADLARALVPIVEYELREDGTATYAMETLSDAARIVASARRILDLAAVYTRLGRATWEDVGAALDVTYQSAQERFKGRVAQFREELLSPEDPSYTGEFGEVRYRLHPAAREPDQAARELDEWVREQPRHSRDPEPALAPVSGQLARMDPYTELRWLSDLDHQLWRDAGTTPPVTKRLAIAERLLQLWEQIAAGEKRRTSATRTGVEHARRSVADLRTRLDSIPPGPDSAT